MTYADALRTVQALYDGLPPKTPAMDRKRVGWALEHLLEAHALGGTQ